MQALDNKWHFDIFFFLLIFAPSGSTSADSGNTEDLSLLNQLPSLLWAKYPTDIGKIHSALPIEIQIDPSKSLPRINWYSINKEAL